MGAKPNDEVTKETKDGAYTGCMQGKRFSIPVSLSREWVGCE